MVESDEIKILAKNLGADLCGVSPVERFNAAPDGFRPQDVYQQCKSVIVFAKKLPSEVILAQSCVPYTRIMDISMLEIDQLSMKLCLSLEERGISAIPIPADDPYEYWEAERTHGRGILSLRHAGYFAGLGVLGRNTLLMNAKYGNMISLGAVLVNVEVKPDTIVNNIACPTDCRICIEKCPQKALDGATVDQKMCRPLSTFKTKKGYTLLKCSLCRQICPKRLGFGEE